MHGQFYQDLEGPSVDQEKSLAWLRSSGLKGEMDSLNNSSPRSSTQYALLSEEHHEATN